MALARVLSCAVVGLEGSLIEVEVDATRSGQPSMAIVGLPDAAVNESKERVRSAIRNSGGNIPQPSRIVVNLAATHGDGPNSGTTTYGTHSR